MSSVSAGCQRPTTLLPSSLGQASPTKALLTAALLAVVAASVPAQSRGLDWAHIFGGGSDDFVWFPNALCVTSNDEAVVCGQTQSPTFPVTTGATSQGAEDAFVTWLSADGSTLRFSTLVGGSSRDVARAVHFDETNPLIYIAGFTFSADYPTTANAVQGMLNGPADAFLTIVATDGTLVYSTFLGGSDLDQASGILVDSQGIVTLVGASDSTDFPTTGNAYSQSSSGGTDVVIARIDPSAGQAGLLYASYYGGDGDDAPVHAEVNASGFLALSGESTAPTSASLPTTANAYQPNYLGGPRDAFVARFDLSRSGTAALLYGSYAGGSGDDNANAGHFAADGTITLGGFTTSIDIPVTANAFQSSLQGASDGYVLRLDPSQSGANALLYASYVGGSGVDGINGMTVDSAGIATLTGYTESVDLPVTTGSFQPFRGSAIGDAWIARLDPRTGRIFYASYLGGSTVGWSVGYVAGLDRNGGVFLGGMSSSPGFRATIGAHAGGRDAIVARFNMLPDGIVRYGDSSPNCGRRTFAGATSVPTSGNPLFSVTSVGAEPLAGGALILAGAPAPGTAVLGTTLWVSVAAPIVVPVVAGANGFAEVLLPLTGVAPGASAYLQFAWLNPVSACGGKPLSATNALSVVVQ